MFWHKNQFPKVVIIKKQNIKKLETLFYAKEFINNIHIVKIFIRSGWNNNKRVIGTPTVQRTSFPLTDFFLLRDLEDQPVLFPVTLPRGLPCEPSLLAEQPVALPHPQSHCNDHEPSLLIPSMLSLVFESFTLILKILFIEVDGSLLVI